MDEQTISELKKQADELKSMMDKMKSNINAAEVQLSECA